MNIITWLKGVFGKTKEDELPINHPLYEPPHLSLESIIQHSIKRRKGLPPSSIEASTFLKSVTKWDKLYKKD
jgi:hypothetical protein